MRPNKSGRSGTIRMNKKLKHLKTPCCRGQLDLIQLERSDQSSYMGKRKELGGSTSKNYKEGVGYSDNTQFEKQTGCQVEKQTGLGPSDECLDFNKSKRLRKTAKSAGKNDNDNSDTISKSDMSAVESEDDKTVPDIENELYKDDKVENYDSKSAGKTDDFTTQKSGKRTGKRYTCDICKRTCMSAANLVRHMYIHIKDKPFSCEVCGKGFIRKDRIKEHVNSVHKGLRPFACNICDKAFTLKQNLKAHMNYHLPNSQYICCLCSKHYKYKGDLNKHMKRVHSEKLVLGETFVFDKDGNMAQQQGYTENTESHLDSQGTENCTELSESKDKSDKEQKTGNDDKDLVKVIKSVSKNKNGNEFPGVFKQEIANSEKANRCEVCQRTYSTPSHLKRHKLLHSSNRPYSCAVCGKGFTRKDCLRDHESVNHFGKRAYECSTCKKTFAKRSHLEGHSLRHSLARNFPCGFCGRSYKTRSDLLKHINRKHLEKTAAYGKSVDSKNGIEIVEMSLEEKLETGESTDADNILNSSSSDHAAESLERCDPWERSRSYMTNTGFDSNTTSQNESFACHDTFQSVADLGKNVMHSQLYKDDACHKELNESKGKLDDLTLSNSYMENMKHLTSKGERNCTRNGDDKDDVKGKNKKLHECKTCEKVFTESYRLKQHLFTHSDKKPFVCSVCGKGFTRKDGLTLHIYSVHTGYRPFSCHVCPKTFTTQQNLNNHVLIHSEERSFLCKYCTKSFKTRGNLTKHVKRIHSPGLKHACQDCDRRYKYKSDLMRHTKAYHLNSDRYICVVCCKDFLELREFDQHVEMHRTDTDSVYECVDCKVEFIDYDKMKEHVENCIVSQR